MNEADLRDCYVPLPIRWRHVVPGDLIVGHGGALWSVEHATAQDERCHVEIRRPGVSPWRGHVSPEDAAHVLVPVPMADAMTLARDELGARLIERRAVTETRGAAA